ncbi:hypothetical protein [Natrinema hispanicum]|uniref:Uncharacterized protein n=1 Tax=Natrinema hispanicum TaxID=392421 RepID=A0A1I0IWD3_9EURY|nr:hypothetical protein [Natrinema hispanicum]SEU00944.1 hypothetical protein SAMN04488694_12621 [Natrinema hispanicum]
MADDNSSPDRYSRPPSFPLSGLQREYVSVGETGNYREAKLEQDVQKKIDQLGERFDRLFSDVELLHENGYLDEEHYADAWTNLMGFDEDDEWAEVIAESHLHADVGGSRPTSAPQKLARKFGQLLFMLMLFPDGIDEHEQTREDMAWGFLHGLFLDPSDGAQLGEPRHEAIEGIIEYLKERLETELKYDEEAISFHEGIREQREASREAEREIQEHIREVLNDADGIEVEDNLTPPEEFARGIDPRGVYTLLVDRLTEDPPSEDLLSNRLGTAGQQALFARQYGPLPEIDPDELVTREDLLAIVKEYNLATKAEIAERVYEDVVELEDAGWKGISAATVVKAIYNADSPLRSSTIAQKVATDSHKSVVTALCNSLAGQKELAERSWRPILEQNPDGWELTAYGEFVADELDARERGGDSRFAELNSHLFMVGLGDRPTSIADRVAKAADEIGLEMPEQSLE